MIEMQATPLLMRADPDTSRACFICLEDEGELVSCCSRCFGVAHRRCWREWRGSQRSAAGRSRAAGIGFRDPFLCSICKSGKARIHDETVSRDWMETVIAAALSRSSRESQPDDTDMLGSFPEGEEGNCCSIRKTILSVFLIFLIFLGGGLVGGLTGWLGALLVVSQFLVIFLVVALAAFRRTWRERRRPVAALVSEEISERTGRLFPLELTVVA